MTLADQTGLSTGASDNQGGRARPMLPAPGQTADARRRETNVGSAERLVSLAAGSILALEGVGRRDLTGLVIAAVGGAMLHRGATGYCHMYTALKINTATDEATPEDFDRRGIHVSQSFLIGKPAAELYAFWRKLDNLPQFMEHLESVQVLDDRRSHWVAKAPGIVGGRVEWDAEITRDEPDARIEWRSLPGTSVDNRGAVRFEPALGDRGTNVHVTLDYLPPAGQVGRLVAKLFGQAPESQVKEDLRSFKRLMETGEVITVDGQPQGTCTGTGKRYKA
jgi:uncharacterized membrane protein